MSLLTDATTEEVERLLALFPAANLRDEWPAYEDQPKDDTCKVVATDRPRAEVSAFVKKAFGYCKQHVHLFATNGKVTKLPAKITDGEKLATLTARSAIYLTRCSITVILTDTHEDAAIDFLWPVKIEVTDKHAILSAVILKKDIASYFPSRALVNSSGLSEETIVADVMQDLNLTPLDVHKGVKALWHSKYMDCHFTKYRKAKSSAYEIVDRTEKKGIRENEPALYEVLRKAPMRQSVFHLDEKEKTSIHHFSVDPTMGTLAFSTYAETETDPSNVVRKILQGN